MSAIWKTEPNLEALNNLTDGTMSETTGMEFTEVGDDYLKMRMPVDERTKQPMGLLHGGASAALAETIGSVSSVLCIDLTKQSSVGIELSCSHLRGVRSGYVHATCRPFRLGRTMHVWDIQIYDDKERLVCVSRLTVTIVDQRS